jgi:hypothetical protein
MTVASMAKEMVADTMKSSGVKQPEAMRILARAIGANPGTLERLIKRRLVHVGRIEKRLNAYAATKLTQEFYRLVGDYERVLRSAERPDDPDLLLAKAAMDEAKKALGLK